MLDLPDSRKDDLDDGRRGVVGRDVGRRVFELDRLTLLSSGFFEDDIMMLLSICVRLLSLQLFQHIMLVVQAIAFYLQIVSEVERGDDKPVASKFSEPHAPHFQLVLSIQSRGGRVVP